MRAGHVGALRCDAAMQECVPGRGEVSGDRVLGFRGL